jgi:LysR family transcriptional regulator, pca operon transcriptional activator
VTMGVLPTAASTLAPGAVQRFQTLFPDAIVRVVEGTNIELLARLRDRALDLVIGRLADAALMFDLSFEPLYEEPLVLVAVKGHPLDGARSPGLAQVCAYPVVLPDGDTIVRAALDPFLIAGRVAQPPRTIETLSDAFARQLVADSDAVWFCAPGVVAHDLASGRFVALDVDLGATRRAVGLTVRSDDAPSPAAAEMAELLRVQARRVRAAQAPRTTLSRA